MSFYDDEPEKYPNDIRVLPLLSAEAFSELNRICKDLDSFRDLPVVTKPDGRWFIWARRLNDITITAIHEDPVEAVRTFARRWQQQDEIYLREVEQWTIHQRWGKGCRVSIDDEHELTTSEDREWIRVFCRHCLYTHEWIPKQ